MKRFSHFNLLLALFVLVNIVVITVKPIFVDPAMYWLYGQHLSWVYFDAPPLIAVITRGATTLFGTHDWVITSLSLLFILASARYLYLLAQISYNKIVAEWITLVFLFTPAIAHIYVRFNWGYNNLLMFFWIMSLYYFYYAQRTGKAAYFYGGALAVALAILSHFEAFFLVLTLLIIMLLVPSYRKLFRNKHTYFSALFLLIIISPYIYALIESHWQSVLIQFEFHATSEQIFFNPRYFLNFLNDIINDLNLFFVMGVVLIVLQFKQTRHNETLKFFYYSALIIFIPFFLLSFHTTFPMKYYMPFYYGFLLLWVPLVTQRNQRYLRWILWANVLLFLIDSWNVIVPRYGISPGNNIFYQHNLKKIAAQLQPIIQSDDFLLGCARDANDVNNQDDYSDFSVLAFYLNHTNTYTTIPGFFNWQKPINEVLAQHPNAMVYYLCEDNAPPAVLGLSCASVQTISAFSYKGNQKIENSWYWQKCRINVKGESNV